MENRKLDSLIAETLEQQANGVSMSSGLQRQIKQNIRTNKLEEESMMRRHLSKRRIVLAAAVMCAAISIVAVAGGKAAGWVSRSNPNKSEITSYAEINKADSHMGAKTHTVEKFTNGLAFDRGFNKKVSEVDDAGVVLGTFPATSLQYVDGKRSASLSLYPSGKDDKTVKHAQTRVISYNGVQLTFSKDHYRFVPADYEVTPEEKAAMDAGQLYITYGSDKVENDVYYFLQWNDGLDYVLMASGDDGIGEEELIQMAKEIIDAK